MSKRRLNRRRETLRMVGLASLWAVTVFSVVGLAHAEESSRASEGVRTLADFLAVAEHSDVVYELEVGDRESLSSAVDELWPQYQGDGIQSFEVTVSDTGNQLAMRECSETAEEALAQAESAFQKKDLVAARRKGELEPDAKLDWLLGVAESGDLSEWTIYELGSRLSPYVAVLLPENHRAELRRFVREHVLVSR